MLALSGLWLSVDVHHAAWETPRQQSLAVFLSCHGVSMNALGKMFGVWTSTILTWIRHYAADHAEKPLPAGRRSSANAMRCGMSSKTAPTLDLAGSGS